MLVALYSFRMGNELVILRKKYRMVQAVLDERGRRVWAAAEAISLPHGGVSLVAQATGLSRTTIHAGIREFKGRKAKPLETGRSRRAGGGRKPLTFHHPDLLKALEQLVEPLVRGDPESLLRWTAKSTRHLADELQRQGYKIGDRKVAQLLHQMGYSLQANAKTLEGEQHPDRNAQFEYVSAKTGRFLKQGLPVISVDTKKKELVGNYSNHGQEWRPQEFPQKTLVHDFPDKELGKAIPYGIYDVGRNEGWVSVGIDHDTAEFAIDSILAWWKHMGSKTYSEATELLIMADAGGSNARRSRLWKVGLQRLANLTGLHLHVSHFPPGTSKWNKIEHRMFSFITQNWRARPLVSYQTVVDLISNTKTKAGLKIKAKLTQRTYPTGVEISASEIAKLNLMPEVFHGDWNYSVLPQ
jgi:transposase